MPNPEAPSIAEWTRTAGPDESLVLTGFNFTYTGLAAADAGADTQFVVYGQTGSADAVRTVASLQRLDGAKSAVTLPATLPAWSMYLVWPVNAAGTGFPIAVNRTDAWWLGFDRAAPGQTVSVYGRNLAHSNGTAQSWVYVCQAGRPGVWAAVTSVNPYRVQFTVPSSLAAGTYQIWIHNGHGGNLGWSGPLDLTVAPAYAWNGQTFNVKGCGAAGDGSTDDSDAIQAAFVAAETYRDRTGLSPTVYFPSGIYMIRYGFGLDHDIKVLGDGSSQSILRCSSSFTQAAAAGEGGKLGILYSTSAVHNVAISNVTLDANGNFSAQSNGNYVLNFTGVSLTDVAMDHAAVISLVSGVGCAEFNAPCRLSIQTCQFTGGTVFLLAGSEEAIDGCNFAQAVYQEAAIKELRNSDFSLTNCQSQDYAPGSRNGQGEGRLLAGSGWFGAQYNAYIAGNTTTSLGPEPGDNMGEQILCEGAINYNSGPVLAATATTVTYGSFLAATADYTGQMAVISAGKGIGQYRRIVACNLSAKTMTVSPAWNVAPDSSSAVQIESGTCRWVTYANHLQGKPFYATSYSAMAGIEPFGGGYEWIADSNSISNMRSGIYLAATGQTTPTASIDPCYFNLFVNNAISSSYVGIAAECGIPASAADQGVGCIGNVIRGNTVSGMTSAGAIEVTDTPVSTPGRPLDLTLYEHNGFSGVPTGFDFDPSSIGSRTCNTLLYANRFAAGTAGSSGTVGYHATGSTLNPGLRANSWAGFGAVSTGTAIAQLETPWRDLTLQLGAGGNGAVSALVWNSGTGAIAWQATTDAGWLSVSPANGTVADQAATAAPAVECNASGLAPGNYAGMVTFSAGGQTKAVLIQLTVSAAVTSEIHLAARRPVLPVLRHTIVAR